VIGLGVLFLPILVSSIPVFVVYIWFRIAKYNFSSLYFLIILLAGAASVLPALLLQNILPASIPVTGRWALFFQIFIRIAFTEELSRFLVLFLLFRIYRFLSRPTAKTFTGSDNTVSARPLVYNDVIQGTAAGLIAGLGFAVLESAVYGAADTGILFLRVFTAAPLHGACGSRAGAAAVMFRSHPGQALFRFFAAVAIHGIYDFMILMPGFPSIVAVLVALSALVSSVLSIKSGWAKQP
jgi:RsiW-degrading membrane proteinase PrsW (M82 family)